MTGTVGASQAPPPAPSVGRRLKRAFLPFAAAYFMSYLFRSTNAVIGDDLARELLIDAAGLGLLTSVYFLAFAAMQLPLGVLLDRFGPRQVQLALMSIAAAGALIFATGQDLATLALGRAIIGLGVGGSLMAGLKANVQWWQPASLPLVNGTFMAIGALGALAATAPLAGLLYLVSWRGAFFGLAALSIAVVVWIYRAAPKREPAGEVLPLRTQIRDLRTIFRNQLFWRVVPATVICQGAFLAYQGLWAGPWLRDINGLDRAGVAQHLLIIPLAMVAGFAVSGLLVERFARLRLPPLWTTAAFMGAFLLVLLLIASRAFDQPLLLWGLFGFLGPASALIFAVLSQAFAPALAGRVNTALNLLVIGGAFLIQAGVGLIIDVYAAPETGGYSPLGQQMALLVIVLLGIAGFVWLIWPRRAAVAIGPAPATSAATTVAAPVSDVAADSPSGDAYNSLRSP